ncbi:MAG: lipoprotein insertase outer membrane protein LolB [Sideroxyarcus sp.]|nr:lipoprotein insertase outer membrane protein LolB [Sideroxyarcus sp.]
MNRVAFLLLIILTGCASAPVALQRVPHQTDAPFSFNGRILVKQGIQRESSGIHWKHGAEDEILLLGPLGYTVGRIHRDTRGATLDDAYGKHYVAPDAEALMQKALGLQLPLAGLRYWAAALPAPESEFRIERNSQGQVSLLQQQGWEIRYLRYTGTTPDALPKQINMRRDDVDVLLQIDEWEAQ